MAKRLICIATAIVLFGCNSTADKESRKYADLSVSNDFSELLQFNSVKRFAPRYPEDQVVSRKQGCATIEYVVTAEHKIENIRLINSTHKSFAREAKNVIPKWNWQALSGAGMDKPIKLRTRFEYCLEDGKGNCAINKLIARSQCPGNDVVASVGTLISKEIAF